MAAEKTKKPPKRHPLDTAHVRHAQGKFPHNDPELMKRSKPKTSKKSED